MKTNTISKGMAFALAMFGFATMSKAVDYHVTNAQSLQNALTLAAANGANNNIYITNGYYTGNFNYNSSSANSLTILPEAGVTNTQITLDGAGTGRDMSISCSADAGITVQGITFLRNCGNSGIGALRIAGGSGSVILVSDCLFLSPSNSSGMGLELASGLNATLSNCTAAGATTGGGGTGISIVVTGNVTVQSCTATTNNDTGISISGGVIAFTGNVVNGNGGGTPFSGAGAAISGTTVTVSSNFFTANSGPYGGASCSGTTVALSGNTFTGNSGGGFYYDYSLFQGIGGASCSGTTVTLSGNTFTGNSGGATGGASCGGTTVTLWGNAFTSNSATAPWDGGSGGAACSARNGLMLSNNTFTGNSAVTGGGGATCSGAVVILTNNAFTGNSGGTGGGGGASCSGTTVTLYGDTFTQNLAATGGGIYASGQTINLLDNLVVKNSQTSTSSQGGGIWVDASSSLFMINNTVSGNTAAGSGGGAAYEVTGVVELLNVYNNIIWGNTASGNGGDVWLGGTGQQKLFNFNDVDSMYGVWDLATNNIDLSPQFFDPVNGDYHTQSTSPCIADGTTNAPMLPATDLDGNPRILNSTVELGCYEFTTNVVHPADTNANFVLSAAEFNAYAAAWKNGQTWTNGPNPGPNPIPVNYATRAGYLMTNGAAYYNDGSARPVNWKINP